MLKNFAATVVAASLIVAAVPALAQMMKSQSEHLQHSSSPNTLLDKANSDMHKQMGAVKMTGDMDRDFIASMIPHHEGAVAMARLELEKGKDKEVRDLAQAIIAAQEQEIEWMKKKLQQLEHQDKKH